MIRTFIAISILSTIAVAFGSTIAAYAADETGRTCAPRQEIVDLLTERYAEVPAGTGVSESGDASFEMFRSTTGSWTITMTTANGVTCVMAAGKDWREGDKLAFLPQI